MEGWLDQEQTVPCMSSVRFLAALLPLPPSPKMLCFMYLSRVEEVSPVNGGYFLVTFVGVLFKKKKKRIMKILIRPDRVICGPWKIQIVQPESTYS